METSFESVNTSQDESGAEMSLFSTTVVCKSKELNLNYFNNNGASTYTFVRM